MTTSPNNSSNRPQQQNGYNPITREDVRGPQQSSGRDYFGELSDPVARCVAVPLLGFIFFFSLRMPLMAPLLILVLLGCLLARLDGRPRQIAAVPLTMSAIKLAFQMDQRLPRPAPATAIARTRHMFDPIAASHRHPLTLTIGAQEPARNHVGTLG